MDFSGLRVGYVPLINSSLHPFDLKNFVHYARKRNIKFEIADPSGDYDLIIISPGADVSQWSRYRGRAKIIFSMVDSYLAISPLDIKGILRGLAKYMAGEHKHLRLNYTNAVKDMCKRADAVICSTLEQKNDIQAHCGNVHTILEFHHKAVNDIKTDYSKCANRINLVWEGRPENVRSLAKIKEVLLKLRQKYTLSLHIITDLEYGKYMNRFGRTSIIEEIKRIFGRYYYANTVNGNDSLIYLYQWNTQTASRLITGCDIAVIPLDAADVMMRGKPENKLLFFWRMGMPAVVSAIPSYVRAMDKAGLNLYCRNGEEWCKNIERLINDPDLRMSAGIKGKKIADTFYSEENYIKQWDALLESVLK